MSAKLWLLVTILFHNLHALPCSSDEDCYLRGQCVNTKCVCDNWAKGDNCEYLNLSPAQKQHQGYLNESETNGIYNTWGGHPIKVNNTYHLFAAQMVNHCTLNGWTKVSQIIRAESNNHLGPYQMKQIIFPTFAHNPQITQAPDGTYLLYYIGVPNNQTVNCTQSPSLSDTKNTNYFNDNNNPKKQFSSADNTSIAWTSGGPIRMGWSKSINGPWKTKTIIDSVEWHTSTNPSPYIYENGTVLLVVARRWCDQYNTTNDKCSKNHKDVWFMYADEWNGPYKNISNQWNINHMNGEDPYIFKTKRGYHMLLHAGGASEGFFGYSVDGINWNEINIASFNQNLSYTDGSSQQLCRRQRPQLLLNDKTGEPMSLWNGAMIEGNCSQVLQSWTLAQPFVGYE